MIVMNIIAEGIGYSTLVVIVLYSLFYLTQYIYDIYQTVEYNKEYIKGRLVVLHKNGTNHTEINRRLENLEHDVRELKQKGKNKK